jgi:hypothetical protein
MFSGLDYYTGVIYEVVMKGILRIMKITVTARVVLLPRFYNFIDLNKKS